MKLRIKPFNDKAKALYENHSHFHSGDAGLDLFVVDDGAGGTLRSYTSHNE